MPWRACSTASVEVALSPATTRPSRSRSVRMPIRITGWSSTQRIRSDPTSGSVFGAAGSARAVALAAEPTTRASSSARSVTSACSRSSNASPPTARFTLSTPMTRSATRSGIESASPALGSTPVNRSSRTAPESRRGCPLCATYPAMPSPIRWRWPSIVFGSPTDAVRYSSAPSTSMIDAPFASMLAAMIAAARDSAAASRLCSSS